ncbi:hypothetical protein ABG79_02458 [Caloramator mitchellensis]|uniref:Uncharacterized protein n=1 Tax=Caloramator mitchellensis TaxID=908809 RepID=A0A0R3JQT7_CALMK|nr:hypothetical protein [Caloramator mitchellensis]KRQ85768.1 hypothetical protein ABG79_02458 [Caloramator mitchellensis]
MGNKSDKVFWENIIEKYFSYEGSLVDFCIENNITKRQFYYHRNKLENSNKPVFHAIALKPVPNSDNVQKAYKDIRIEIGKANIIIPASESELIITILKELEAIC